MPNLTESLFGLANYKYFSWSVCLFMCIGVCGRQWPGLLSLLSVILALAKMGGMERNIAYWPAD